MNTLFITCKTIELLNAGTKSKFSKHIEKLKKKKQVANDIIYLHFKNRMIRIYFYGCIQIKWK